MTVREVKSAKPQIGRERLALMRSALRQRASSEPPPRAVNDDEAPLHDSQVQFWLLNKLSRDSASAIHSATAFKGRCDIPLLKVAYSVMIRRHESLRTSIVERADGPHQVIRDSIGWGLEEVDLSPHSRELALRKMRELMDIDLARGFDLEHEPLLRATLFKVDEHYHVLFNQTHHIITDGWSNDIFLKELLTTYESLRTNLPIALPANRCRYLDFVAAERAHRASEAYEAHLSYWREKLLGVPVVSLPYDRPPLSLQEHGADTVPVRIRGDLRRALERIGRAHHASLSMTVLAALNVLLFRFGAGKDICLGMPISVRPATNYENVIGLFVNVVAIRSTLAAEQPFTEFLQQVRQSALEAYSHRTVAFEKVIEALDIERSPTHLPVYQVMLAYQNYHVGAGDHRDKYEHVPIERRHTDLDLSWELVEVDDEIVGVVEYKTSLFDRSTVERLVESFDMLLHSIVRTPSATLASLDILSQVERDRLVHEWSESGQSAAPPPGCILERLQRSASKHSGQTALVDGERTATYEMLERRANQMANHLLGLGLPKERPIAIHIERSLEMVVAVLAVLKAGRCYVPLDVRAPMARNSKILEDCRAAVVLTQKRFEPLFACDDWIALCVDAIEANLAGQPMDAPAESVRPNDASYLIYTSGSTGTPKGTVVEHRGLAEFVQAAMDHYGIASTDSVLQFASICFDASIEEIFPVLVSGGRLVLRTEDMISDAYTFLTELERMGVNVISLPTAYWHMLCGELDDVDVSLIERLRLVIIGGEKAQPAHLARWRARVSPKVRLLNTYGPTECCVVSAWSDLSKYAPEDGELPIGRPFGRQRLYVLDESLNPVPVGVAGELHISGPALARGYLNQPELTSARFVDSPFGVGEYGRLYRSGDIVKYSVRGDLIYLGRNDNQVKIRGFRIELGEIEKALLGDEDVKECCVRVESREGGTPRIVALVVPRSVEGGMDRLRGRLSARLPEYMIPSQIVALERLPTTTSGKIDLQRLMQETASKGGHLVEHVEPKTPTERELLAIWRDVLKLDDVSLEKSFFEQGGNSLLATSVVAKINKKFGVRLRWASLFEQPTIRQLAREIRGSVEAKSPLIRIASAKAGPGKPMFVIPGGGGDVLIFRELSRQLGDDVDLFGLQALGTTGRWQSLETLADYADEYLKYVRQVQGRGPYRLCGHCLGGSIAFEMARKLAQDGQDVAFVALLDSLAPVPEMLSKVIWPRGRLEWLLWIAEGIGHGFGVNLGITRELLESMQATHLVRGFLSRAEERTDLLRDMTEDALEAFVESADMQVRAVRSVAPIDVPLDVVVFAAADNPMATTDADLGWGRLLPRSPEVVAVAGNHYSMLASENVQTVAALLRDRIGR